jgi:hypothetical protein
VDVEALGDFSRDMSAFTLIIQGPSSTSSTDSQENSQQASGAPPSTNPAAGTVVATAPATVPGTLDTSLGDFHVSVSPSNFKVVANQKTQIPDIGVNADITFRPNPKFIAANANSTGTRIRIFQIVQEIKGDKDIYIGKLRGREADKCRAKICPYPLFQAR